MRGFFIILLLVLLGLQSWWVWNHCPEARRTICTKLDSWGIHLDKCKGSR
jgi:hypothetical protein